MKFIPESIRQVMQLRADYKAVFSTPSGQNILKDLMKKYVISDPVVQGDPQATQVNIGMQRLAQLILRKALTDEQSYRRALEQSYENHE
jgi:hypothetical protein